jgi:hypothetical protein
VDKHATSPYLSECLGNFGAFVLQGGGNAQEGAFLREKPEVVPGGTACFTTGSTGLVFAEHRN